MSYQLYKTVGFGTAKGGLGTVGYTLTGGSRITAGVSEIGSNTGIYGATITFADGFAGSILWDTGGESPIYAAEEVNPRTGYSLAASGLDSVTIESGVNARQAMSVFLAACGGVLTGVGTGLIDIQGGNVETTRISAETDDDGNRTSVVLTLPS